MSSLVPSLKPTERKVVDAILADRSATVETTAQELAERVGVSRTTVVRTAQALGYEGFPQLRVAVAQELALEPAQQPLADAGGAGLLGQLKTGVNSFAANLSGATSALTEETLRECIESLDKAQRVLVVANGMSNPLGVDLVQRLNSVGRPAEMLADAFSQQIAARQLGEGSVCFAYSGSGANKITLDAMRAARQSGATVIAMTSFTRSAMTELADIELLVPPVRESFQDELLHTSRAALMVLTEQIVALLTAHRGERGREARLTALSILGPSLQE